MKEQLNLIGLKPTTSKHGLQALSATQLPANARDTTKATCYTHAQGQRW